MMDPPDDNETPGPSGPRLTGWKEIANHLGRGIRTAQRWEHEFDLPVRCVGGDRGESVFAVRSEIDGWLASISAARARTATDGTDRTGFALADEPGPLGAAATQRRTSAAQGDGLGGRRARAVPWVAGTAVAGLVLLIVWGNGPFRPPESAARTSVEQALGAAAVYHLDEGTGTVLLDSGGGQAHGEITNGAWTNGRVGKGLDFWPGFLTERYMFAVFPGTFPFHAPGSDASLSFWMLIVDGTHRTLFWTRSDAHSPDADRFHIYSGGVKRVVGPAIGVDYQSPLGAHHLLFEVPISLGRWVHVVLVRAGTRHYTLYLDGEPAGTHDDARPELPTFSTGWALWRTQDNQYPKQNGRLDEITLWHRALSALEVRQIFLRSSGVRPADEHPSPEPSRRP